MSDTEEEKKTNDWARLEALRKAMEIQHAGQRNAAEIVKDAEIFLAFLTA